MQLKNLILAVKEKSLSKDQLEGYRDEMSHLYAEMQMEMAELEKRQSLYMDSWKELSVAQGKVKFNATSEGQRLTVLKRYCLATKELLNSLKSRLYSIY